MSEPFVGQNVSEILGNNFKIVPSASAPEALKPGSYQPEGYVSKKSDFAIAAAGITGQTSSSSPAINPPVVKFGALNA